MSNYNTGNPVPSIDPRDLDDNATKFDQLLLQAVPSVPDRLGVARKTWWQMELDAAALASPNVAALAAVTAAVDKGVFFSALAPVTMGSYTLTGFNRSLGSAVDDVAFRAAISAMALTDTGAYAGSAAKLTTARSIAVTGDATWSVSFDGSGNATAALTLNTVPVTKGGTGAITALEAGTALGVGAVGTNTDQLAKSSMIQSEIANKRAWTAFTPTVTATTGSFTEASATGKYMVSFGICHVQIAITITTVGTGTFPIATLPFAALEGSAGYPVPCKANGVTFFHGGARITTSLLAVAPTRYDNGDFSASGEVILIMGSYPVA